MAGLAKATAKAGDAMDALKQFARESSKTAEEVRKGVAEARRAIAQAGKAADKFGTLADRTDRRIEQLSEKLIDDAEQLSKLLSSINRVATKIDAGKGSAGQLLNDPKLYNDLLDATDRLSRLLKEAQELFAEWKKNGVPLKIK
jgi:methyl-accepting chemotaxis protein